MPRGWGRGVYGANEHGGAALPIAVDPFSCGHYLDRASLLLQLRPDAVLRRDRAARPQRRDPEAGAARPLVVPLGRHGHIPEWLGDHSPPDGGARGAGVLQYLLWMGHLPRRGA